MKLGQYEIVRPLRSGGMATLLLGRRSGVAGFSKYVAIKRIREPLTSDERAVSMFLDEARILARIQHPNVVHVEELGEQDDRYFLVMEYVHGCSLAQLLDGLRRIDRGLTVELCVHIVAQIADGLHAAHELSDEAGQRLNVVHRDVSPQNVLLSHGGHIKLIDFGVAKARDPVRPESKVESIVGKLAYMSPEQLAGDPVDRRSDIYSLGVVLWEMLTMRQLFWTPPDHQLVELVERYLPDPPSTFAEDGMPALDEVVLRALALDLAQRHATARDLRIDLLDRVPGAREVDAQQVAMLLGAVLDDEMRRAESELPAQLTQQIGSAQRGSGQEELKHLTRWAHTAATTRPWAAEPESPADKRGWWWIAALIGLVAGAAVLAGVLVTSDETSASATEEPSPTIEAPATVEDVILEPGEPVTAVDAAVAAAVEDVPSEVERPRAASMRPRTPRTMTQPTQMERAAMELDGVPFVTMRRSN